MSQNYNSFYPYTTLNSVLRKFCLSCIYHDGVNLKHSWSIFKNVLISLAVGLLNATDIFFKLYSSIISTSIKGYLQVVFLWGYLQYIVDLYFVYKYGRDACLQYFRVYDYIDRMLNETYNDVIKRCISNILFYFTSIGVITILFDYVISVVSVGWQLSTICAIEYIYLLLDIFRGIEIIVNIVQIEYRLKMMVDMLEDFYLTSVSSPKGKGMITMIRIVEPKTAKYSNRLNLLKTISLDREYSILKLNTCYLLLLEQADFINNMYGLRILLAYINILIQITTVLNVVMRFMLRSLTAEIQVNSWCIAILTAMHFVTLGAIAFSKLYRAEQTYRMTEEIIRLVDLTLVSKKISYEVRDSLKGLRELVASRPVEFHAVQFFRLDYKLLLSMTSEIVTFTIILMEHSQ